MATPQTRFQPMMARAPMAFHASPVSAAQLPVYTRPAVRGVKRIFAKCYSTFKEKSFSAFSRHRETERDIRDNHFLTILHEQRRGQHPQQSSPAVYSDSVHWIVNTQPEQQSAQCEVKFE